MANERSWALLRVATIACLASALPIADAANAEETNCGTKCGRMPNREYVLPKQTFVTPNFAYVPKATFLTPKHRHVPRYSHNQPGHAK
jgi:hypothetical protein